MVLVAMPGSTRVLRVLLANGAMVKALSCGPVCGGWRWIRVVANGEYEVRVGALRDNVVGPRSARVGSLAWSPMRACKKLRSTWRRGDMEGLAEGRPSGAW